MPGYHAGRPPRNKGRVYPADPPTVEEIVAVMREVSDDRHGYRLRAPVVVLWRGGLRVAVGPSAAFGRWFQRSVDMELARCATRPRRV